MLSIILNGPTVTTNIIDGILGKQSWAHVKSMTNISVTKVGPFNIIGSNIREQLWAYVKLTEKYPSSYSGPIQCYCQCSFYLILSLYKTVDWIPW
jgi:hypothetical protein